MKSIIDAAIQHPVITSLFGIFIVMAGLFSLANLPMEQDPRVSIPVVIAVVPYPGASPEDVESGIAQELDIKLNGVNDVEFIATTCMEGACVSMARFLDNVNIDRALQDVRDAVKEAQPEFPADAEEPRVQDVAFDDMPLMLISLSGEKDPLRLLAIAEDLQDDLEGVPGIASVTIYGGLKREVEIRADSHRLQAYGLTLTDLVRAVKTSHHNLPGGELDTRDGNKILVRTVGEAPDIRRIGRIVLTADLQGVIRIADVASVRMGADKRTSISRLNGRDAVTLILHRHARINTLMTVKAVEAALDRARLDKRLPDHVQTAFTHNQAQHIWILLGQLLSSAAYGAVLVVSLLFLFMGSRNAILITMAIPFSLMVAFIFQILTNLEISNMTMFSTILILGMVVDGAIIVGESIYHHLEKGADPLTAARRGIHEVAWPVVSADLTTISAFIPMIFMRGVMGQHMAIMPKIVTYTLLGSMLVDHFILPMMAGRLMKTGMLSPAARIIGFSVILMGLSLFMPFTEKLITAGVIALIITDSLVLPALTGRRWKGLALSLVSQPHAQPDRARRQHHVRFSLGPISRFYKLFLEHALQRRRAIIAFALLLFAMAVGVVLSGAMGNEFFPETDIGKIIMHVEMPPGTTVEQTAEACREIEKALGELPPEECEAFVMNAGQGTGTVWRRSDAGPTSGPEFAQFSIELTDEFLRRTHHPKPLRNVFEIRRWLRARLDGKLPGLTFRFDQASGGPPVGMAVVVRCAGDNLAALTRYADKLHAFLNQVPGTMDAGTSHFANRPEIKVKPRRADAARWRVPTTALASTLMTAFMGMETADLTVDNENLDIRIQWHEKQQGRLEDIQLLEVPTERGGHVPLVEVADVTLGGGLAHIQRRNQARIVNVFCDVDTQAGYEAAEVRKAVTRFLEDHPPPAGQVEVSMHGEMDEEEKSMEDLQHAFAIALLLIFTILTIQFNSFRQPLVVLLAIPLALVGAVLGLYLTGVKFGFMATVGIVALVGIVVNDNIVLVDYCNQLRQTGMPRDKAIVEAGLRRLRPILLTTVTTLGGLVPLTLNWSGGGAFWLPLGVTIIFGLGLDSLLTLILVPVIYSLVVKDEPLPAKTRPAAQKE